MKSFRIIASITAVLISTLIAVSSAVAFELADWSQVEGTWTRVLLGVGIGTALIQLPNVLMLVAIANLQKWGDN